MGSRARSGLGVLGHDHEAIPAFAGPEDVAALEASELTAARAGK
jgi:hypothetical protein